MNSLKDLLPDFKPGPLDYYRKKATFDWKEMKILLEGEEMLKLQMNIWNALEKDVLFQRSPSEELSSQQHRHLCFQRMKRLMEYEFFTYNDFLSNPLLAQGLLICIGMYDWSLSVKRSVSYEFVLFLEKGSFGHMGESRVVIKKKKRKSEGTEVKISKPPFKKELLGG